MLLDTALHGLGRRLGDQAFVVAIGARDDRKLRGTRRYVDPYDWGGLFIEPEAEPFEQLAQSFAGIAGVVVERIPAADLALSALLDRHDVERTSSAAWLASFCSGTAISSKTSRAS